MRGAAPSGLIRWSEWDPFGHLIVCAEDVWAHKAAQHPDIVPHEAAIRDTIRAPDEVYDDPRSAVARRPTQGATVGIHHYYGRNRAFGRYGGKMIAVVIKWRQEPGRPDEWYVQTAFLTERVPSRLVLLTRRRP
jgi:hypothetical protein